jgi:hypothetical protein
LQRSKNFFGAFWTYKRDSAWHGFTSLCRLRSTVTALTFDERRIWWAKLWLQVVCNWLRQTCAKSPDTKCSPCPCLLEEHIGWIELKIGSCLLGQTFNQIERIGSFEKRWLGCRWNEYRSRSHLLWEEQHKVNNLGLPWSHGVRSTVW